MSARRKSTINLGRAVRQEQDLDVSAALQLERLEQETTLVLQKIDQNLLRANAVINDKMFPILKQYASATSKVWENVGFWKHFMEEAADVEVKTSNDVLDSQKNRNNVLVHESTGMAKDVVVEDGGIYSDDSSLLGQIQASTPQQPRSRALLLSARGDSSPRVSLNRKGTAYKRPINSLNKSTPLRRQSETEARRLSLILKHLNSSPTLPEPPILMSEIGKLNTGSSSSAAESQPTERQVSTSDSESLDLDRLLPILLPSITLTPQAPKPALSQERSIQRFPNTPVFGSSTLRPNSDRHSLASPVQRGQVAMRDLVPDAPEIPAPEVLTFPTPGDDESDELVAPQLLSLRTASGKRGRIEKDSSGPKKKKVMGDENDNVFLDQNNSTRNNSTIYHTMAQESPKDSASMIESNSKSMSQIFERVLLAGPSELNSNSTDRQAVILENIVNDAADDRLESSAVFEKKEVPQEEAKASTESARSELTGNLSHGVHSFDSTTNSSDMDSFFREKWKSLTGALRK